MATPEMIDQITGELIRALEITMNPVAEQSARQEAYTAYENFKVIYLQNLFYILIYFTFNSVH